MRASPAAGKAGETVPVPNRPKETRVYRNPRALCLVGVLAAAVAADLALQYTEDAAHLGSQAYAYLLDVPPARIRIGHFVGVIAILAEILGFYGVAVGIHRPFLRRLFFGLAALAFAVGAAFHAMFASIGGSPLRGRLGRHAGFRDRLGRRRPACARGPGRGRAHGDRALVPLREFAPVSGRRPQCPPSHSKRYASSGPSVPSYASWATRSANGSV